MLVLCYRWAGGDSDDQEKVTRNRTSVSGYVCEPLQNIRMESKWTGHQDWWKSSRPPLPDWLGLGEDHLLADPAATNTAGSSLDILLKRSSFVSKNVAWKCPDVMLSDVTTPSWTVVSCLAATSPRCHATTIPQHPPQKARSQDIKPQCTILTLRQTRCKYKRCSSKRCWQAYFVTVSQATYFPALSLCGKSGSQAASRSFTLAFDKK